ncbi:MAG: fibrobacter succinogenes major paralogous domain-containing protein [Bacteroidetes bacterium]|nr:fibrobacter succinogenes major paralogous domain-containing protein [Bacteroidota bacterium]
MLPSSCKKDAITLKIPNVTTGPVNNITESSASCGGDVTYDGETSVTERGVCWSTSETPTTADDKTINGQGTGSFTGSISGLTPNTLYHVCAYAVNGVGIAYGSIWFIHTGSGTVKDIDSNLYHTVTIGTQEWTCENLKTTRLNNGAAMVKLHVLSDWQNCTQPGYGGYEGNDALYNTYGPLYNGYAAGSGKLCPNGWHIPDTNEWNTLEVFLGGSIVAGGKLKEAGTQHWIAPNKGATNESGFSALPGGFLYSTGGGCFAPGFQEIYTNGLWWSQTQGTSGFYNFCLGADTSRIYRGWGGGITDGLSVRCIRD